jgi:hypothetical protein
MSESWADIEGYKGLYQVSDHGRVRSFHVSKIRKAGDPPVILMPSMNQYGYLRIELFKDSLSRKFVVHRLVAAAFLPERTTDKDEVNHIDGNKSNNRLTNLEWVSRSENQIHASRTTRKSANREVYTLVSSEGVSHSFSNQREFAEGFGLNQGNLARVISGKAKHHKGFRLPSDVTNSNIGE